MNEVQIYIRAVVEDSGSNKQAARRLGVSEISIRRVLKGTLPGRNLTRKLEQSKITDFERVDA